MGANYQPTIQQGLKERSSELDELHSRLMLGARHHAGVNRKDDLLQAIARADLDLTNWQAVKF